MEIPDGGKIIGAAVGLVVAYLLLKAVFFP